MSEDSKSRKWQLTINNPVEHGLTHDEIKNMLNSLKALTYYCICDETGDEGTYHTHVYLYSSSTIRFSTLKKKFGKAHMEMARGTSEENRLYIRKEGKWKDTDKSETNHIDTFEEWGEMPVERQGARNDIHDLYAMIKEGLSNFEIMEQDANYMLQLDKIERARQIIKEEQYKNDFRKLDVVYIFGDTGSGKTRGVMEQYGYTNVYRITDYLHPFDNYKGQDVIIFEEFRSSLKIQDMLNYLDGYPLDLPCRYNNKAACFTKVYIITNLRFEEQYLTVQRDYPKTWQAFIRRIQRIVEHTGIGIMEFPSVKDYYERYADLGFYIASPVDEDVQLSCGFS